MPPKKKSKTEPKQKQKQKQKQSQKQVVNVTVNNNEKKVRKRSKTSSSSSQNSIPRLQGNPTKDMVYRNAAFNRPVNYNIVPELPLTGNQLISEMRQLMNVHTKEIERTPIQMTEDVRKTMMKKADGIVKNTIETQTEYPKDKIDAANKIKANIKQKISSDALEEIIDDEINKKRSIPNTMPRSTTPRRRPRLIIGANPDISIEEYRRVVGEDTEDPPLTLRGNVRKNSRAYKNYIAKKNN